MRHREKEEERKKKYQREKDSAMFFRRRITTLENRGYAFSQEPGHAPQITDKFNQKIKKFSNLFKIKSSSKSGKFDKISDGMSKIEENQDEDRLATMIGGHQRVNSTEGSKIEKRTDRT